MERVNKHELVREVATKTDLSQTDAKNAIEALFDTISENLAKGNKIQLIGFGTFEVRHRAARKGRNPQTGKEISIPATQVPAFKPGKDLKNSVQK